MALSNGNRPSRYTTLGYTTLGVFAALAAAACSVHADSPPPAPEQAPAGPGDPGTTSPTGPRPSAGMAMLRAVHASADAPRVDVWAYGMDKPLATNVGYGDTSPYLEVPPGTYTIELRASPSTASDPVAYSSGPLTIKEGQKITAVAAGTLGSKDESDKFRLLPLAEGFAPAGTGKAIVRVVHASPDAPTVDLDVGNDNPGAPEVSGLRRFADTGDAGIPLSSGAALQIGIAAGGATVTAFTTPYLPEGAELFVIATGGLGKLPREADGFELLAVGPNGTVGFVKQNPTVYAFHASPDAPCVDAFAGNAKLVDGLTFGTISRALQVPPGEYSLDFYPHTVGTVRPEGQPASTASTGALEAGERYLSVATGFLGASPGFELVGYREEFALGDSGNSRVRAIHASPDAPAVDVGIANGGRLEPVLVNGLSFPGATDNAGLSILPQPLTVGLAPKGADSTVVARFEVTTVANARSFGIVAGSLANQGQGLHFYIVHTTTTPWSVAK
jgi:hypothetical protein